MQQLQWSTGFVSNARKAGYHSIIILVLALLANAAAAHGFRGVFFGQKCGNDPEGGIYLNEKSRGANPLGLTGVYDNYLGEKEGTYHGFEFAEGERIFFAEYFCGYQSDQLFSGRMTAYFSERSDAVAYFKELVDKNTSRFGAARPTSTVQIAKRAYQDFEDNYLASLSGGESVDLTSFHTKVKRKVEKISADNVMYWVSGNFLHKVYFKPAGVSQYYVMNQTIDLNFAPRKDIPQ